VVQASAGASKSSSFLLSSLKRSVVFSLAGSAGLDIKDFTVTRGLLEPHIKGMCLRRRRSGITNQDEVHTHSHHCGPCYYRFCPSRLAKVRGKSPISSLLDSVTNPVTNSANVSSTLPPVPAAQLPTWPASVVWRNVNSSKHRSTPALWLNAEFLTMCFPFFKSLTLSKGS